MTADIELTVDGVRLIVPAGTTVAAAVLRVTDAFRRSVTGTPRGPLCGMGVCLECRVVIDGAAQQRSCQTPCRDGMEVRTDG
jgi:sarcosine oxidase subunit alpha